MAAHCTNNFFAILLLYRTPEDRTAFDVFTYQPTWLGVIVALGVAGILLLAYHLTTQKNFEE